MNQTVDPEWRGFRRHEGRLYWNGWSIFGHILPLIGVVTFPCYADGSPVEEIGATTIVGAYERRALVIEWLGHGVVVAFGGLTLRQPGAPT